MAIKYDSREDQQISQAHRTVSHDDPWSFLLYLKIISSINQEKCKSKNLHLKLGFSIKVIFTSLINVTHNANFFEENIAYALDRIKI